MSRDVAGVGSCASAARAVRTMVVGRGCAPGGARRTRAGHERRQFRARTARRGINAVRAAASTTAPLPPTPSRAPARASSSLRRRRFPEPTSAAPRRRERPAAASRGGPQRARRAVVVWTWSSSPSAPSTSGRAPRARPTSEASSSKVLVLASSPLGRGLARRRHRRSADVPRPESSASRLRRIVTRRSPHVRSRRRRAPLVAATTHDRPRGSDRRRPSLDPPCRRPAAASPLVGRRAGAVAFLGRRAPRAKRGAAWPRRAATARAARAGAPTGDNGEHRPPSLAGTSGGTPGCRRRHRRFGERRRRRISPRDARRCRAACSAGIGGSGAAAGTATAAASNHEVSSHRQLGSPSGDVPPVRRPRPRRSPATRGDRSLGLDATQPAAISRSGRSTRVGRRSSCRGSARHSTSANGAARARLAASARLPEGGAQNGVPDASADVLRRPSIGCRLATWRGRRRRAWHAAPLGARDHRPSWRVLRERSRRCSAHDAGIEEHRCAVPLRMHMGFDAAARSLPIACRSRRGGSSIGRAAVACRPRARRSRARRLHSCPARAPTGTHGGSRRSRSLPRTAPSLASAPPHARRRVAVLAECASGRRRSPSTTPSAAAARAQRTRPGGGALACRDLRRLHRWSVADEVQRSAPVRPGGGGRARAARLAPRLNRRPRVAAAHGGRCPGTQLG